MNSERTTTTVGDWREDARCRTVEDPDIFFPSRADIPIAALAVCAGCSVRAACRDDAIATAEPHGVWGGLTEQDRRALLATPGGRRVSPRTPPSAWLGLGSKRIGA